MIRVFLSDLKRALISKEFCIGVAGTLFAGLCGALPLILAVRDGMSFGGADAYFTIAQTTLSSDIFLLAMPIVCVIPFTTAFVEELRSRFLISSLPRAGMKSYLVSKMGVTALSGGITIFCGVLLLFIMCAVLFPPDLAQTGRAEFSPIYARIMFESLCPCVLSGCLWAVAGGLFSTITKNKYMAYAAPFIFYYILVSFQERYFRTLYFLNPQEWAAPQYMDMWKSVLILIFLCAILSIAYIAAMRKRVEDV